MDIFIGILIPFIGTTFGASLVYLMKNNFSKNIEKILLGFASGVMIAASIWSLIIPSIEMSNNKIFPVWFNPSLGFFFGVIVFILLDIFLNSMKKFKIKKSTMLTLAVTVHNFPEGMAVGVIFAGVLLNTSGISLASSYLLSLGIAIQNIPEGAIISLPKKSDGLSKTKAFISGMLSGLVEPIGALLTIFLTNLVTPILSFILSFAAGAMFYVVSHDLIPESVDGNNKYLGPIGLMLGFLLMMILDVQFS